MNFSSRRSLLTLSDLIRPKQTTYSEILYVVFFTINCAIYTLYVDFVLIWFHLSFIVFNNISHIVFGGGL